jgi:hypothetical protein
LNDTKINIFPYSGLIDKIETTTKQMNVERKAEDVVTYFIENNFIKGKDLIDEILKKSKEIDKTSNISDKIQKSINYSLKKCQEKDSSLQLSDTISNIKEIGIFLF